MLLQQLDDATVPWLQPVAHELEVSSVDGGSKVEARLAFASQPPLDQWSLLVGDCAHNVRTALDVFVWANSSLLSEDARQAVAYPILAWTDELTPGGEDRPPIGLEDLPTSTRRFVERKVAGLPMPLRSHVLNNMDWSSSRRHGRVRWTQTLPLIRELDDIDKHRLALDLESNWDTATWYVWGLNEAGTRVEVDDVSWSNSGVAEAIENGHALVATGRPPSRLASVGGWARVELGLRVRLFELRLPIQRFLEEAIDHVDGLLDVLSGTV